MSTKNVNSGDSIDLIKIILDIWNYKYILIIVSIFTLLIALSAEKFSSNKYGYKINFSLNILLDEFSKNRCYYNQKGDCYVNVAFGKLLSEYKILDEINIISFDYNLDTIEFKSTDPNSLKKLNNRLLEANIKLTENIDKYLKNMRDINQNFIDDHDGVTNMSNIVDLQSNYIKNLKIISEGKKFFNFSSPQVIKYPSISGFIKLLIFLIGPIVSIILIIIKSQFKSIK